MNAREVRLQPLQAHCLLCHELFAHLAVFDAHRDLNAKERRCLTPDELRERSYVQRRDGMWTTRARQFTN